MTFVLCLVTLFFFPSNHPLCSGHTGGSWVFETYKAPSFLRAFVMLFPLFFPWLAVSCHSHLNLDVPSSEKPSLTTHSKNHSFFLHFISPPHSTHNKMILFLCTYWFSLLLLRFELTRAGTLSVMFTMYFQCLWTEFLQSLDRMHGFSLSRGHKTTC